MTPHFDFVALAPELIIAATLALVLVVDLFTQKALTILAVVGCAAAFVVVAMLGWANHSSQMFSGRYTVDDFSLLAKAFFTASAAVVFLYGLPAQWKGEYCQLILASVLGMMALSSSRDLLLFFVSFELFALPAYLLTGWNKKSARGAEAALKYYLLGAIATALMLYGISFLYGIAGGTSFSAVSRALANGGDQVSLARIAIFFFIIGMAFKISAVPFHLWTPDAYQGAPIPVAAFLSVASKVAGFVALLEVVNVALPGARAVWAPIIFGLSIASMVVGSLMALRQTDAIRLLAYSAIAQAGYILIPLAVAHGSNVEANSIHATFEYLLIYAIANLGAFAGVLAVAQFSGVTSLTAFNGLFSRAPGQATVLAVCMLSLAGIPPLGGWFAKFVVVRDAVAVQSVPSITIAVIAAATTAIGLVFYLSFIRRLWLDPKASSADIDGAGVALVPPSVAVVITVACVALVVIGVLPGFVTDVGGWSSLLK